MPTCKRLTYEDLCSRLSQKSVKEILIEVIWWVFRIYENEEGCQAVLATKDVSLNEPTNDINALNAKLVCFDGTNVSETITPIVPMSSANIALAGIPSTCVAFAQYGGIGGGTGEDVLTSFMPSTTICFDNKEPITSVTIAFYEMPNTGGSFCSQDLTPKTVNCVKGTVRFINT